MQKKVKINKKSNLFILKHKQTLKYFENSNYVEVF